MESLINKLSSANNNITGWYFLFKELKNNIINYNFPYLLLSIILIISLLISLRKLKNIAILIILLILSYILFIEGLVLIDMPVNYLNAWMIPIIFTLLLSNSIFIIYQWNLKRNLYNVYSLSGRAILLTLLSVFFITLPFKIIDHNGISLMVNILLLGISYCAIATFIILPILLERNYGNK